MQEVRGNLGEGIVSDVLRHVAFLRDTGRLVLLSGTRRGIIAIRSGRPVHAACRRADGSPAHGLEALAALLGWESGTYRFDPQAALDLDAGENGAAAPHPGETLAGDVEELLEAVHARRAKNGAAHRAGTAVAQALSAFDDPADPMPSEDVFLFPSGAPAAIGPKTVLSRHEVATEADDVAVPRGALSLWLRLDGTTALEEHAGGIGVGVDRTTIWAARLVHEGLAYVEPEPVVAPEFVQRLSEELIEIMGPMGEILVEESVEDLRLDPDDLPVARIPDLIDALAGQLQRSDWQMRLRGRAARLQAEWTIPPGVKEPR